ncbi:hypothetical protein O7A61_07175 [Mesorhizobium sp. Cs1321R2N1]
MPIAAGAQSMSPMRGEVTSFTDAFAVRVLLDCYSVSASAPAAFSSAPSGGGTNVTFVSVFRLDGSGVDNNGDVPQRVVNGTHAMQVDLTATKSSGIFPAGSYQGIVTVLCE